MVGRGGVCSARSLLNSPFLTPPPPSLLLPRALPSLTFASFLDSSAKMLLFSMQVQVGGRLVVHKKEGCKCRVCVCSGCVCVWGAMWDTINWPSVLVKVGFGQTRP